MRKIKQLKERVRIVEKALNELTDQEQEFVKRNYFSLSGTDADNAKEMGISLKEYIAIKQHAISKLYEHIFIVHRQFFFINSDIKVS